MPYINANGTVVEKRSIMRFSIFSDIIWGVVNFIGLFVTTLIQPRKAIPVRRSSSDDNTRKGGGRGGGPNIRGGPNIHSVPKNCSTGG